jgi:hypothetical protein
MGNRTPLYSSHVAAGARMVDFGGWDMPVSYGSQIEEHHAVRRDAGMFDVSHMCVVDLRGARVREYLRRLLANDVDKLRQTGKALYSCMLRENGVVIDDLIVYYLGEHWFRMVVNAGTREKDLEWLRSQAAAFEVSIEPATEIAMIAVQGPNARSKAAQVLDDSVAHAALVLQPFFGVDTAPWFIARTGYTGEDGWEIMLPAGQAADFWQRLREVGVVPCGLGARDTLRDDHAARVRPRLDRFVGARTRFHRPRRARRAEGCRRAAQARRAAARGSRGDALASEGHRARGRRRRDHERNVLANDRAFDRPRARAGRDDRSLRSRDSRAVAAGPRRASAVRAQRHDRDIAVIRDHRRAT